MPSFALLALPRHEYSFTSYFHHLHYCQVRSKWTPVNFTRPRFFADPTSVRPFTSVYNSPNARRPAHVDITGGPCASFVGICCLCVPILVAITHSTLIFMRWWPNPGAFVCWRILVALNSLSTRERELQFRNTIWPHVGKLIHVLSTRGRCAQKGKWSQSVHQTRNAQKLTVEVFKIKHKCGFTQ